MFNIWKQAWRYTDHKTNKPQDTVPVDDLVLDSPEIVRFEDAKHESGSTKRSRDQGQYVDERQNKKARSDAWLGTVFKKDSVANYLPEVLVGPQPHIRQPNQVPIKSDIDDIFKHVLQSNSKWNRV